MIDEDQVVDISLLLPRACVINFPLRLDKQIVCHVPAALGRVTSVERRGLGAETRILAHTESGIPLIAPIYRKDG